MTQALYAHMNNKTIKKCILSICDLAAMLFSIYLIELKLTSTKNMNRNGDSSFILNCPQIRSE
jgi:hypothetical protein